MGNKNSGRRPRKEEDKKRFKKLAQLGYDTFEQVFEPTPATCCDEIVICPKCGKPVQAQSSLPLKVEVAKYCIDQHVGKATQRVSGEDGDSIQVSIKYIEVREIANGNTIRCTVVPPDC